VEIVFVSPRSKRSFFISQPAIPGFTRVDTVKIHGVTFSQTFSVTQHVERLLSDSAQTIFAQFTLRHHGVPGSVLHTVFQVIVVAKLSVSCLRDLLARLLETDSSPFCTGQSVTDIVIQPMRLYLTFVARLTINHLTIL